MNEPARVSLARRLPYLIRELGTESDSISGIKFNLANLTEWKTFPSEIHDVLQTVDLDVMVPVDDTTDKYIIGSESGLTGRFAKHLCDPVINVLIAVRVPLRFGDRQAIYPPATIIPDIVLSRRDVMPPSVIMEIELKTFWTFDLAACLSSPLSPILLTHIKKPLDLQPMFTNFNVSSCPSPYRLQPPVDVGPVNRGSESYNPLQSSPIGHGTILFSKNGIAEDVVNVTHVIQWTGNNDEIHKGTVNEDKWDDKRRAVFEGIWHGEEVVVKCWVDSEYDSYLSESRFYEELPHQNPSGYPFFPQGKNAGDICCSSLFPFGFAMIMSKVKGTPLRDRLKDATVKRRGWIRAQLNAAVKAIRALGVIVYDCGPHKILYHGDGNNPSISIIDFERLHVFGDEKDPTEGLPIQPEVVAVFGFKKDDDKFENDFDFDHNEDDKVDG
ncbi:hypothetical protein N7495_007122 [Penicillium taxi]|uniref:uncharacterized protein n=1 Tax=Penicillium taxi TaxID=168475 RepID=UPI00254553CA|nr:uncharacterized protein N7495_007122 [Penicillium taxi]KAJ5895431.1 hypothetical protein N7495_007122 [Penicillium taxi]